MNLNTPIQELGFSTRVHHTLRRNGLNTLGDLIEFVDQHGTFGLLRIRLLGKKAMAEVEAFLSDKMAIVDQPPPTRGQEVVWPYVVQDLKERVAVGRQRYGTELQTHNGRDALVDAYQEALDLCLYLRQAILERDRRIA